MRDKSFQSLLAFTLVYGLFGLALLAAQPKAGAVQTADAGGNFEVPADFGWFNRAFPSTTSKGRLRRPFFLRRHVAALPAEVGARHSRVCLGHFFVIARAQMRSRN